MTVKIVFGGDVEQTSQDEMDSAAVISGVKATRTATTVGVEDKNGKGQRAHITADVVLERGVERLLLGEDWCGAWRVMAALWTYLGALAQAWQADPHVGKSSKTMLNAIIGASNTQVEECRKRFRRGGVDLENAWFTEPKTGSAAERRAGRTYFNHPPVGDEVPDETYRAAKWRPKLSTEYVAELEAMAEAWVATRVRLPWTSLDADSRNTSDKVGVKMVVQAIETIGAKDTISKAEAVAVSSGMIINFDFFPPTINESSRTIYHAAAVAARHVVEHYKFHIAIRKGWRSEITEAFLEGWHTWVEDTAYEANGVTVDRGGESEKKKRKAPDLSETPGLAELLAKWETVCGVYRGYVTTFSAAVP